MLGLNKERDKERDFGHRCPPRFSPPATPRGARFEGAGFEDPKATPDAAELAAAAQTSRRQRLDGDHWWKAGASVSEAPRRFA